MTDPLEAFARAWEAGRVPDPDDYLERVPLSERAALSERLRTYLLTAPEPEYSEATWEALAADPAVARAAALPLGDPEPWPTLLPRLRARARVSWAEVAGSLGVSRPDRAEDYLEAMERGEHAPARVTRRALAAIARALDVPADALAWTGPPPAALLRAPAAAGALAPSALEELDRIADLATRDADAFDDVELLFCGGRELE